MNIQAFVKFGGFLRSDGCTDSQAELSAAGSMAEWPRWQTYSACLPHTAQGFKNKNPMPLGKYSPGKRILNQCTLILTQRVFRVKTDIQRKLS